MFRVRGQTVCLIWMAVVPLERSWPDGENRVHHGLSASCHDVRTALSRKSSSLAKYSTSWNVRIQLGYHGTEIWAFKCWTKIDQDRPIWIKMVYDGPKWSNRNIKWIKIYHDRPNQLWFQKKSIMFLAAEVASKL